MAPSRIHQILSSRQCFARLIGSAQTDVLAWSSFFFVPRSQLILHRSGSAGRGFHSYTNHTYSPYFNSKVYPDRSSSVVVPSPMFRRWPISSLQVRYFAKRKGPQSKKDDNAPLLNEYLIAELLKRKPGSTADTYEVRLVLDVGKGNKGRENDEANSRDASTPTTEIVSISKAISIAHENSLDLMEVSLKGDPPVVKALDFEKFLYQQKRKEAKSKDGKSIGDKPLKEFKFRAGIADHDLERKAANMVKYLTKGHAVRVTLTARLRALREDTDAIKTTLDRVKELVGDKAVEVKELKSNERGSYGNLLLHPNLKK